MLTGVLLLSASSLGVVTSASTSIDAAGAPGSLESPVAGPAGALTEDVDGCGSGAC